jgi:RNA-directed DNA polymerase
MKEPTTEEAVASQCRQSIALVQWPKLQELRAKLGLKAKQEKRFRFYSLYCHVCRPDTLAAAWATVRCNGGACGVDGVTIGQIAASPESEAAFLAEIECSLREKTYRAQAIRRVYIQKPNGKLRPLGIPTVRDRVVQCAVKLIIEPIFEADFKDCSFGFRPGRSAHQALEAVQANLREGRCAVYDADLASYFDTIPHDKLLQGVRQRVVDRSVVSLINMWLKAPVIEPADRDASGRSKGGPKIRRAHTGTPQGGVLSPLLANLHLHWFDRAFCSPSGPKKWANARLVRYADDFIVAAKFVGSRLTAWIEETIEGRLGLQLNREKTRVIGDLRVDSERLDFLGYSFRYDRDRHGRERHYWNVFPSPGALVRERKKLTQMTDARQGFTPVDELIERLNRHLCGWANYFSVGYPRKAYRDINNHVHYRLGKHLRRRSQRGWAASANVSVYAQLHKLGLKTL